MSIIKKRPLIQFEDINQITVEWLQGQHKKVVFLDVDNTLFLPKIELSEQDLSSAVALIQRLQDAGIKIVALSNNFSTDRKAFFDGYGIHSIFFAKKPLPSGFSAAYQSLQDETILKQEILHIGDQLLTDGMGAIGFKIEYALVKPLNEKHDLIFAKPSRWIEKILGIRQKENRDE